MNEQLFVTISEIIIAISAVVAIIIVIAAAWRDVRQAKNKDTEQPGNLDANKHSYLQEEIGIGNLINYFIDLSKDFTRKAFENVLINQFKRPLTPIFILLLSLLLISMVTYFFYTAATMKSSTLLSLSWALVCLWLAAIVWFNASLQTQRKLELTFGIPFAYFIFYAYLFVILVRSFTELISRIRLPKISLKSLHEALLQEAYSTRF